MVAVDSWQLNPFSTEAILLVGYWSPITYTLLYTYLFNIKHQCLCPFYLLTGFIRCLGTH